MAQRLKRLPPIWETQVRSLGREDPLEKEMAIHSNTLAWRIPWTEQPSRLQSTGAQRVGHDWLTSLSASIYWKTITPSENQGNCTSNVILMFTFLDSDRPSLLIIGTHRGRKNGTGDANKLHFWDFPGGPLAGTLCSQSRGPWVQSLVRELDPTCCN